MDNLFWNSCILSTEPFKYLASASNMRSIQDVFHYQRSSHCLPILKVHLQCAVNYQKITKLINKTIIFEIL
jgi:hypothetical protein